MFTLTKDAIAHHNMRGQSPIERIQIIAGRFHCLENLSFVQEWDAMALDRWAMHASHTERCAAQFVLQVWNIYEKWKCGKFDVVDAFCVWDQHHKDAFLAWALNPVNC